MATHAHAHHHHPEPAEVLDPVCGMTIDRADAVGTADYNGQTYYFCSDSCLTQFRADPALFVDPGKKAAAAAAADPEAEYTCPGRAHARSAGWRSSR
jgi:P-type Cu+ transporter